MHCGYCRKSTLALFRTLFSRFSLATREAVQWIVIDMYAPYVSLVKKAFPECSVDHRPFPHRPTYWQNLLESSSERNHGTA